MSKRQFWLGCLVVLVLGFIIGPVSYFGYHVVKTNREAEIQQTEIEQKEATKRTEQRWKFLNNLPWVDKE